MTDVRRVRTIPPDHYADEFIKALDNPKRLWDTAFRTHIPEKCRHLLFALFFGSQYGEDILDLRPAYQALHSHICAKYGKSHEARDFEKSLRILEGSFIRIQGTSVSFVNPSFRDYLTEYLDDVEQLKDFAAAAQHGDWARQLWRQGEKISDKSMLADFASAFKLVARKFPDIPMEKQSIEFPGASTRGIFLTPAALKSLSDGGKNPVTKSLLSLQLK